MKKRTRKINEVTVVENIDKFIIDNLLFLPNNKIDNICGYINLFLNSGCSCFSFNIEGKKKTLSISKVNELCTEDIMVYKFIYHNKINGSRLFYERYVTRDCIVNLFKYILKISIIINKFRIMS